MRELWAAETVNGVFLLARGFGMSFLLSHALFIRFFSIAESSHRSLYRCKSTLGCIRNICQRRLYLQTAGSSSSHRGQRIGMLDEGAVSVDSRAMAYLKFTILFKWCFRVSRGLRHMKITHELEKNFNEQRVPPIISLFRRYVPRTDQLSNLASALLPWALTISVLAQ